MTVEWLVADFAKLEGITEPNVKRMPAVTAIRLLMVFFVLGPRAGAVGAATIELPELTRLS